MSYALAGLVLPPEHILRARMDVVTQTYVPDSQAPGLLFTSYVPLRSKEDLTQLQLRELFISAFGPYSLLQSKFDVFPVTYQWKHDDVANLWDAVPVTGPAEYLARAQPAVSITATPSPAYLDNAPKFVAVYQAILRPMHVPALNVEAIDSVLNEARITLRDHGFPNSMFSVNVQGVTPEPGNDFARTLSKIALATAVGVTGFMVTKAMFMRTRI